MGDSLAPCSGCHRHVRRSERVCPFCGTALIAVAPRERPRERLGTVAWFTFAVGASVGACGGLTDTEGKTHDPPPPVESPDASDASWTAPDGGDDPGDFDAGLPPKDASTDVDSGPIDPYDAGGGIPIYKAVPKG